MLIVIKGAGDLASGIAYRLKMAGFDIVMTESEQPTAIRHTVAFARAIYTGETVIEGVKGVFCKDNKAVEVAIKAGEIAVVVDEEAKIIQVLKPDIVVDAIIAKHNLGTALVDAKKVIGVGPGFTVDKDCHYVIETMRGHYLGRIITEGSAQPNTGIPGEIGGYTKERIIRAPKEGLFRPQVAIGDEVKAQEIVGFVGEEPVVTSIGGTIRGMLFKDMFVTKGFKCGDVDPRCVREHCFTISDKARSIAGGVLEAVMRK